MALRLIKILPPEGFADFESLISEEHVLDSWIDKSEDGGKTSINLLADVGLTEKILGDLETKFSGKDDYRVILLPISATLPSQPDEEEEEKSSDKENNEKIHRISRDELYEEINKIFFFIIQFR